MYIEGEQKRSAAFFHNSQIVIVCIVEPEAGIPLVFFCQLKLHALLGGLSLVLKINEWCTNGEDLNITRYMFHLSLKLWLFSRY